MTTPLLGALLGELIDYAGLFPPAKLPLDESIRNYARYRTSPEAWMLGRFICPASRLGELDAFADLFTAAPPFRFSVLGRGGDDHASFTAGFDADLAEIAAFHRRHPGRVTADAFEVRLPADVAGESGALFPGTADAMRRAFAASGLDRLRVALEVAVGSDALASVLDAIATANAALGRPAADGGPAFGPILAKLRLGGVTAEAFPSVDEVAAAIVAARDRGVPLKLTAGLHHPIRRRDAATGAMMHGFLNVYAAGVLAAVHDLEPAAVADILADERADHVSVSADTITWNGRSAGIKDVARLRRDGITSTGSCSFDEPREDLAALGLLSAYSKPT